jgi:hypothetical protein
MIWRGVRDEPGEEEEARLLTEGEQLPCSEWVNAPPPASPAMLKKKKLGDGKARRPGDIRQRCCYNIPRSYASTIVEEILHLKVASTGKAPIEEKGRGRSMTQEMQRWKINPAISATERD